MISANDTTIAYLENMINLTYSRPFTQLMLHYRWKKQIANLASFVFFVQMFTSGVFNSIMVQCSPFASFKDIEVSNLRDE